MLNFKEPNAKRVIKNESVMKNKKKYNQYKTVVILYYMRILYNRGISSLPYIINETNTRLAITRIVE